MNIEWPIVIVFDDASVSICRSRSAITSHVEIYDVETYKYYDSLGRKLKLGAEDLSVESAEDIPTHADELKQHLCDYLDPEGEFWKNKKDASKLPPRAALSQMPLRELIDLAARYNDSADLNKFKSTPGEEAFGILTFVGASIAAALFCWWWFKH